MPTPRNTRGQLNIRKQRTSPIIRRQRYSTPRKSNHKNTNSQTPAPNHRLAAKTRFNPVTFVQRILGETLWEKQQEILTALRSHRLVAVRSCNASGKTYAAALAPW